MSPYTQRNPFRRVDLSQLQSDDLSQGIQHIVTQENMRFVDAGLDQVVTAPDLGPFRPDSDTAAGLGSFLSRPVLINSFQWQEGVTTPIQTTFNPWTAYFNDPVIKRKLDNFRLMRCKLHLKFVVNASPFYYGAMRVSYCPLATGQDNYYTAGDQIKLSQTPGLFLEPANMTTSEMELPFLWPNSWLDATEIDEFSNMGRIQYVLYSKLRSANGVAGASARIVCYAWTSEVETAGLTSLSALQSDEYEQEGSISGPASAVANVAAKLAFVPGLGQMATATAIGASAVSGVARLFGYSNPPVISDSMPFTPKAFHAFSSVDTSVPMDKLTLDPKNEVTVDNAVTGAGSDDPLDLTTLLSRESFIQGTLWTGSYAEGTILWTAPVTPIVTQQIVSAPQTYVNYTPAAYFGKLFRFWRGSITYRFRFIKSRYHTGRLQITWDPAGEPTGDYDTTTQVRIVDLQQEDEVTVTIPYKQPAAWMLATDYAGNFSNGTSPAYVFDKRAHNGVIQIRTLTTLTGPAASPQIDILAFVAGTDDLEYSVPNELPPNCSDSALQSEDVVVEEPLIGGQQPEEEMSVDLVTVGETVKSLRTLLHRSSFVQTQVAGNPRNGSVTFVSDGIQNCVNYFLRCPTGPGFGSLSPNWAVKSLTAGSAPFMFAAQHPLNWVINCFTGYRGSIVHHFNVENNGNLPVSYFAAERDNRTPVVAATLNPRTSFTLTANISGPSSLPRAAVTTTNSVNRRLQGARGMAMTNCETQTALSVVTPQYSQWRFRPAYGPVRDIYPTTDYNEIESIRVDTNFRATGVNGTSAWPILAHYAAAGVDFNPVYFVCTPTLYSFAAPTPDDAYAP